MAEDYSGPVLPGNEPTDYARYMQTDALLSLQQPRAGMTHPDELLFITVHQSAELWLQLACAEADRAATRIAAAQPEPAELLLARACLAIELITGQLHMLRHLPPWDFGSIRPALGHGSGFESPGWRSVGRSSRRLDREFAALLARREVDLVVLYQGSPADPLYRLAERLVDWDQAITVWRVLHVTIATRIIGHGHVVGTKGTPVAALSKLVDHRFFPDLWRVRTRLTEAGPMGHRTAGAPR